MKYAGANRGSALMLVVGLLTIIAMLGSTFLVSSYLDAQQAEAIANRGPITPLINGVISQIAQLRKFDLYLAKGVVGAYGGLSKTSSSWRLFLDYPGEDIDPDLAELSLEPDAWRSIIFGNQDAIDQGDTDTTGDGEYDADLYNVRVMNINGDPYYMAVRVIDTSGLININSTGTAEADFMPIGPAWIDLKGYLAVVDDDGVGDDSVYQEIVNGRRGTGSSDLKQYSLNCGRRLLSAAGGYTPFSFADETWLRWRKIGSEAERSELFEILKGSVAKVPWLTTFSSSPSALRYPGRGDERTRILIAGPDSRSALTPRAVARLVTMMTDAIGSPDAAAASSVIADNPSSASGWQVVSGEGYNGSYLRNGPNAVKGPADISSMVSVVYTFYPPEDGDYKLAATIPVVSDPAPIVKVMHLTAGMPILIWNQATPPTPSEDGYRWAELGELKNLTAGVAVMLYLFPAGTEGYTVCADAMRLTLVTEAGSPEAVHFAANAWAYLSTDSASTEPFGVTSGEWKAYGVVPQLVISEVFTHSAVSGPDTVYVRGIELFNPTDVSITGKYRTECGGAITEFDVINVASKGRIVLSSTGPVGATDRPSSADHGFSGIEFNSDGFPDDPIRIERLSDIYWVPVDSVTGGEVKVELGTHLAERDDDFERQRCLIPVYYKSDVGPSGHTLGAPNVLTLGELSGAGFDEVMEGFSIRRMPSSKAGPDSVGDFGDCYVVGPDSAGVDLPHKLHPIWPYVQGDSRSGQLDDTKRAYYNKLSRGRAHIGFTNPEAKAYPDVPWATLLAEFIETVEPDPKDGQDPHQRIYGRININTAPKEVLATLPFPQTITWTDSDGNVYPPAGAPPIEIDPDVVAQYILDYREDRNGLRSAGEALVDPSYDSDGSEGSTTILREDGESDMKGFFTPGEIAIPLAVYCEWLMAQHMPVNTLRQDVSYLDTRDSLYNAVISCVTVNSSTFAVTATVSINNPPRQTINYLAIIDRSNCQEVEDTPTVMLLTEIK